MLFSSLNEDEFELQREFIHKGVIYKEVRIKNRGTRCLNCGTYTEKVKEYRTRKIIHNIYHNESCIVLYHQRRFICPKCGKTRMEDNPFTSDDHRISDKTILNILETLKRYNVPFTQAAEMYGISTMGVMKIFDRYVDMKRLPLSKIICLDEIYFSRTRKKKYVLVIINFANRAVLDILKDRDKSTLSSYFRKLSFKEKDRVEYVCIDMNDHYRDIVSIYFKNATIVADSYHVVKHVHDALDEVRKRIMRRFEDNKKSDEYYLLKYRDELLFQKDPLSAEHRKVKRNHHFRYDLSEAELLEMTLKIDKQLKDGYELYHEYVRFNGSFYEDPLNAVNDLSEIINDFRISGIREFEKLANTLDNWRNEIVNSFIRSNNIRVSNGPIEGRNSLIKKILKIANGYTNFKRFRNRVMYCLNRYSDHSFRKE